MAPPGSLPAPEPSPSAASLRIDRAVPRRRRAGWGVWVLSLAVLAAVGGVAWSFLGKATSVLGGASVREGRATRSSPNSRSERTTASGYVVARTRAAISSREPGKLVKLYVDVGDRVKAGDLLAELDHVEQDAAVERWKGEVARTKAEVEFATRSTAERRSAGDRAKKDVATAEAALREAVAWLEEANRDAARQEDLLARKVIPVAERDRAVTTARMAAAQEEKARASLDSFRAERERAAGEAAASESRVDAAKGSLATAEAGHRESVARRDDAFLRAPFSGVVLRKEAEVGEVIAPAVQSGSLSRAAALSLADFSTLEMEVDVFERDVSLVEPGAPARIVLDAYPKDPFPGKVRQVVPTADRQKATVQVKVAFDEPDPRVLPEMGGKAVFLASGTEVSRGADRVTVPAAAMAERAGRRGVFLLEREGTEEHVRFIPVQEGEKDGDLVVARSGLTGGERVVLDPPSSLADGARVTIESKP